MTATPARLVLPHMGLGAEYLELLRESVSAESGWNEGPLAEVVAHDLAAHLASLNEQHSDIRLPSGQAIKRMPFAYFWLVSGAAAAEEHLIGRVSVRYELSDWLRRFGGHIGYAIRPAWRRQGYGRLGLQLAIDHMRTKGLDRVLLTCADTNVASARVIESCGGVLEDRIPDPTRPDLLNRRYWITIDRATPG
jgi:predicted acetyltransferase